MKRGFMLFQVILVGLALAGWGCSNPVGFSFTTREGESPEGEVIAGNGGGTLTEQWIQPQPTASRADLIFVTDTSGSLDTERVAMANALSAFLSKLTSRDVDVCIGVLLGHVADQWAGNLYSQATTDPSRTAAQNKCLCVGEVSSGDLAKVFLAEMSNQNLDETASDGGEAGFYSFRKSFMDDTILTQNMDSGCYRDTAALVAIFLSDENEISTSITCASQPAKYTFNPVGPAQKNDPQCDEMEARATYYSTKDANDVYQLTLSASTLYEDARVFQGPLGFLAEAVGYVGTVPGTATDENEYPWGFVDQDGKSGLVNITGGDPIDLKLATDGDQAGFEAKFVELGDWIADKINLQTVFDLAKKACEGTIEITVDGTGVADFLFDGSRRVTIKKATDAGSAGSVVRITYDVCE